MSEAVGIAPAFDQPRQTTVAAETVSAADTPAAIRAWASLAESAAGDNVFFHPDFALPAIACFGEGRVRIATVAQRRPAAGGGAVHRGAPRAGCPRGPGMEPRLRSARHSASGSRAHRRSGRGPPRPAFAGVVRPGGDRSRPAARWQRGRGACPRGAGRPAVDGDPRPRPSERSACGAATTYESGVSTHRRARVRAADAASWRGPWRRARGRDRPRDGSRPVRRVPHHRGVGMEGGGRLPRSPRPMRGRRSPAQAVAARAAAGAARIHSLRVDGRAVASLISFVCGGTAFTWKIAYDEAFARFSPGAQVMLAAIESLLAEPKITRLELVRGTEPCPGRPVAPRSHAGRHVRDLAGRRGAAVSRGPCRGAA